MTRQEFIAWEQVSRDTIDVKRCYVDIAGDLVAGILLSQIVYWHLPGERQQPFLEAALAEMRGNMQETPWDAGHSVIRTRARNLYHLAVKRGERP